MTKQERQGWMIVASLFVTLLIVFGGGYNTFGVFFTPLLNQFGWSRAQLSTLQSALAISAGFAAPLIGWLLDRVEARIVIAIGAALAGLAYLGASQATSYVPMLVCYALLGLGVGGATLLPCSLVVANWFKANRGLALGVTFAGTSIGGMLMTLVANYAIAFGGWRAGYIALAVPMIIVVIPLALFVVRTRPANPEQLTVSQQADLLPGLELRAAVRTRSFWMLAIVQFVFAFAAAGTGAHLIAYLIGLGYTASAGALVVSLVFLFTSFGKLVMGRAADRVSGRATLAINFLGAAVGISVLLGVTNAPMIVLFVLIFGFTLGGPLVLVPVVMAESLGLKRFGTLAGVTVVLNTVGGAVGPIAAGRIFDLTGSYTIAFEVFVGALLIGVVASMLCLPLHAEESRLERALASA
ncbi:MAG: MFS transporter [Candidatus Binataceae bacterium]